MEPNAKLIAIQPLVSINMPGKSLLDLPLECLRAILKEAVAGQCPWSISEAEDNEDWSDQEWQPEETLTSSDFDSESQSEDDEDSSESQSEVDEDSSVSISEADDSSQPIDDIRVVLQWRRVNRKSTFFIWLSNLVYLTNYHGNRYF